MKQLSPDEFFEMLQERVRIEGSQKALAEKMKVSQGYLNDVLRRRKDPGEKLLRTLNYRAVKITNYVSTSEQEKEKE